MRHDLAGSTNTIFRLDPPSCCIDLQNTCERVHLCQWLKRNYLRAITATGTKILVVLIFCLTLTCSAWGIHQIEDGLDVKEFIPRDTPAHRYFDIVSKDFNVHTISAVTKGNFEYPHYQQELHDYHRAFGRVDHIIKGGNGLLPEYWLATFRDWLLGKTTSLAVRETE